MSTVIERQRMAGTASPSRIRLTANDCKRLRSLLWSARRMGSRDMAAIVRLEEAVESAVIVPPDLLPADVVSIHSRVRFRDQAAGTTFEYTLVFPAEASVFEGRVSILSPVGSALLGRRVGEKVLCRTPGGESILRVLEVVAQPEAAGQY